MYTSIVLVNIKSDFAFYVVFSIICFCWEQAQIVERERERSLCVWMCHHAHCLILVQLKQEGGVTERAGDNELGL
jgi:hypothetical protein